MARNTSVIGIYEDRTTVSDAINVLHKAGYRATDISFLSSDNQGSKDFAHEKHTKAPEGAATGAAVGSVVGAALAWFLSSQTVPITGLGPLIGAGPVLAALAGAGAGGALGWIAGLLAGLRRPEYVARRYAGRIRRGGILLSVHCDSQEWSDRAKKTLKDTGARNISSASEAAADYGMTDKPTERAPAAVVDRGEAPAEPVNESVAHQIRRSGATAMTEYVGPIEKQTLENTCFRQVLFTGKHTQLVVMCLGPLEEIGDEVHKNVDQFFRIEQGEGKFVFNGKHERPVWAGDAVVVPAGTYHNVINTSKTAPFKLYTLYSPPNHPDGTVHKTRTEVEAAEAVEHR